MHRHHARMAAILPVVAAAAGRRRRRLPAIPTPTPPVAAAPENAPPEAEPAKDDTAHADEADSASKTKARVPVVAAPPVADSKHMLEEAERLLHAERFAEAAGPVREADQVEGKSGAPRFVGLAEISFQEKNYIEAVQSAAQAVDRGGGVRARVLLGDAHFRLSQYKEAAKAYGDALKLDPDNASAKAGLALAQKRM